jgi:endonuclease YncB( thermonuclease family)
MSSRSKVVYDALVNCVTYLFCNSAYQHNELQNINIESLELFSLKGKTFLAKIIDVYDGDTITVAFKEFGKYSIFKCRIMHIDTPEIKKRVKPKNEEERIKFENEKKRAIIIRDIMREKLLNQIIHINCDKFDLYGRLLVEFNIPETNIKIHTWLIENNYAKPYEGKHKEEW